MAGPSITSRASLKRYMLSRLGAPVVNIELTDEQLDNAINDALDEFLPRAYSGMNDRVYPVRLLPNVQEYLMPYDVWAVTSVNSMGVWGLSSMGNAITNPFHVNNFIAADLYKTGSGKIDILSYEMAFESLATLDLLIGSKITFDYNCFTKILFVFDQVVTNTDCLIQCYRKLTPQELLVDNPAYDPLGPVDPVANPPQILQEMTNIFDQKWIKRMSTEKARYQWGTNLIKYGGSVLPNGGTLNYQGILDMAEKNIDTLLKELFEEMELPADFFIA